MIKGSTLLEKTGRSLVGGINLLALGLMLLPLVLVCWLSVISNEILSLPVEGYTLHWYQEAFRQPQFLDGFILSVLVAAFATAAGLAVSIPAAVIIVRRAFRGRGAILQLLMSPLTVPAIVIGASLYITVVEIEIATGLPLSGSVGVFVMGHILLTIPWCIRLLVASLEGANLSIEEAAASLGDTPAGILWRVTLPLIRPGIFAAAVFSFVVSFGNLEVSIFLASPGQVTLPVAMMQYLEWKIDPTIASVSVLQVAFVAAALMLSNRFVNISRIV
ncbi:ABC transporter permease subunit [Neorhizobium galegae]|uniref:ABC transporter permease n=1 Tax=Neorhizobium galegae TaxID=399 RepID=UPI0013526D4C|nr:ABC transporter permease subunit [Neorhizobium galegae]KAB1115069.1 ABC transporter permease subunit [Neorhizobium galegae]MCQ1774380.1 ABC transporter permease subunit [Neorhizobium galegae]MCQ1798962.1 ABC transporter permease subunit [Neorhizobium galegae]